MMAYRRGRKIQTVTGPIAHTDAGITDAHNHVWIAPVVGAAQGSPVLDDKPNILEELRAYREAGGGTQVDCQPGGCGRDGRVLRELAERSGVNVVAATGYHLQKYYPPDYWLFRATAVEAYEYFVRELTETLEETRGNDRPVRAGFIKIACEATVEQSPQQLMEAAARAQQETGVAVQVHTEKGSDVERIVAFMHEQGVESERIVLCHMDKRPDLGLHRTLAREGLLLEYDTFYRPKYRPDQNLWPLLRQMVDAGLASQVVLATDMADANMWATMGGGPGLTGLITQIVPRLRAEGISAGAVSQLVGGNIADCLAL